MNNNINVVNNTGKDFKVTVNENGNGVEIVINLAKSGCKLPKNLKPGDTFKDIDGDEYILWYYLDNGDVAIICKENLLKMKFGSNNNYNGSDIDKYLCNTYLPELERKFGSENLVEYDIDLLSLDGESDYGVIKRKVGVPTLDQYRLNKNTIKKFLKETFFLATPNSTPSGYGSGGVHCVGSDGGVDFGWYGCSDGLRPFFVLKSQIFES